MVSEALTHTSSITSQYYTFFCQNYILLLFEMVPIRLYTLLHTLISN